MYKVNSFYKLTLVAILVIALLFGMHQKFSVAPVYSQRGSSGKEVTAVQKLLKEWGLFNEEITGYYGPVTEAAVKKYQKYNGLSATGVCDKTTLTRMGITIGVPPTATQANINLLARIISAEGRGESYEGQVAIGAVILNRIEHPSFPDTLSGIIYQDGAFTAMVDGQFNEAVANSAYSAARDALNGWDPSGGAIYYFNPAKTSNAFIWSRPVIKVIGAHRFCS